MLKFYYSGAPNPTKIALMLEETGLPYEPIPVDTRKGDQHKPEFLKINPNAKVPAIVDGDATVFDSSAILLYLGEKHGVEKQLWPGSAGQARADAVCWTVWAMTELGNYMMQYLYHGLDTPFSYKPEDRSKACAEYNRSQFIRGLDALQARLQNREYLLDAFSLVDIPAASWLMLGTKFGIKLDTHPRVADWLKRCGERPACKRAR